MARDRKVGGTTIGGSNTSIPGSPFSPTPVGYLGRLAGTGGSSSTSGSGSTPRTSIPGSPFSPTPVGQYGRLGESGPLGRLKARDSYGNKNPQVIRQLKAKSTMENNGDGPEKIVRVKVTSSDFATDNSNIRLKK